MGLRIGRDLDAICYCMAPTTSKCEGQGLRGCLSTFYVYQEQERTMLAGGYITFPSAAV